MNAIPNPYLEIGIFILGLIWGSFFNVCIIRIPENKSLVFGASQCRKCGRKLRWFHNIPVFSFLFLGGKCGFCKKRISIQYPLVELASAAILLATYMHFGMTLDALSYVILLSLLLVISVIDFYHFIIPDELSLSGIVVGFVFTLLTGNLLWWESLLGIVLGIGTFLAIALLYEKMTGREGLGGGDVKLLGMLGGWLGYQSLTVVILTSTALGSIVGVIYMLIKGKDFKASIPFGPFLAVGGAIYLFFGKTFLHLLFPLSTQ